MIRIEDLRQGGWYKSRGYKVALKMQNGRHFILHDDDMRPWLEWNKEMLVWLKETVADDWTNTSIDPYSTERYILFKDEKVALSWKLVWG